MNIIHKIIRLSLLAIASLFLSSTCNDVVVDKCNIDDWAVLKAFYESTDGDNWLNNSGWEAVFGNEPTDSCNLGKLYGVDLDGHGRVKTLRLSNNLLNGNIPTALSNLISLRSLELSNNQLNGIIPSALGNLICLNSLELSNNQLNGIIPSTLGNLTALQNLELNNNQLSGCYPVNLLNLTIVGTNSSVSDGNNFDAPWEEFIYNFDGSGACSIPDYEECSDNHIALITFSLDTDGLNWDLNQPPNTWHGVSLNGFGCVTRLLLSNNQLTGSISPELGNLSKLISLSLSNNKLSGNIPPELGNLSNLTSLGLSGNQLIGSIPSELGNLSNLIELALSGNQLIGSIPPDLGNLSNLQELYLSNNQLSGSIPLELGNLVNLKYLFLSNNQLIGSIPVNWNNLTNFNSLSLFSFADNNLSGCYPSSLSVGCSLLSNSIISDGNNFDASWSDFCATGAGACPTAEVYPGDLNHDGIVNNQDIGLSGLYLYEIGPPRTIEHQNTEWYAHPADDWERQHINNEDIKHFDSNGDGAITDDDRQAVDENFGMMWSPTIQPLPVAPEVTDYQVMLQPVDLLNNGYLIYKISLERRSGGNMDVRGGHFTIDYSFIDENINYANLVLLNNSWLGNTSGEDADLRYEIRDVPNELKIEIGFTKTNNLNSLGSGIIGDLIISYESSLNQFANVTNLQEVRVTNIGVQNGVKFTRIEDEVCTVNITEDNCQTNWSITENTPFQNRYKGQNLIETNGFLIIGDEQQVEYRSNRVCLQSGFKVKAGASFKAGYGSCD